MFLDVLCRRKYILWDNAIESYVINIPLDLKKKIVEYESFWISRSCILRCVFVKDFSATLNFPGVLRLVKRRRFLNGVGFIIKYTYIKIKYRIFRHMSRVYARTYGRIGVWP